MNKADKIYIAGHTGLIGTALLNCLRKDGYINLITKLSSELDLTNQNAVKDFFYNEKPDIVFLLAAKTGGIAANNTYPADFIFINTMIVFNIVHAAWQIGVKKLIFPGCACMYPKNAPQPMKEKYLLSGDLESTSEPYSIAKIAGIKMCQAYNRQFGTHFITCILTNVYGPNDNFNLDTSHVIPALIRKFHTAKIENKEYVTVWGTGKPVREFIYVDDAVNGLLFLIDNYDSSEPINIGTGEGISIAHIAEMIKDITGFKGEIKYDLEKPDGVIKKLLDVSQLHTLGWRHKISLQEGLIRTYEWYLKHQEK